MVSRTPMRKSKRRDGTRQLLLCALLNDKEYHPERGNAAFDRVAEALDETLGTKKASDIASTLGEFCKSKRCPIKDPRAELDMKQANAISTRILQLNQKGEISSSKLTRIVQMLQDSEISSGEAIELHRRYKIPVSLLEEDVIPVRGEGVWITRRSGNITIVSRMLLFQISDFDDAEPAIHQLEIHDRKTTLQNHSVIKRD